MARQQLLFLQRLPDGGGILFCSNDVAQKFVGKHPQLGFTSPFAWSKETTHQDQALHGERARLEANSPHTACNCPGRWVMQGKDSVRWWLCAWWKGDTLLQRKEMRSGEEGVMG